MSPLPLRLKPGEDLRRSLERAVLDAGPASAFVVAGIGSLAGATLRFADVESESRMTGPFEIVCLSGTISRDGAHLHMAIADAEGRVTGGHLGYGNEVRTTAEVLLVRLSEWDLAREPDAATGFKELVVRPRRTGQDDAG